jgi:hypothetical protein
VPLPDATIGGSANWINDRGAVCGDSIGTIDHATLWLDTQPADMGAPPAGFPLVRCLGIANDAALGAGVAFAPGGELAKLVAFRHGAVTDISLADSPFNTAFNVNKRGVVSAFGARQNPHTLIVESVGYTVDLHTLAQTVFSPLAGDTQSLVNVVTTRGRVYGFSFNDTTQNVVMFDPRGNGSGSILQTEPLGAGAVFANDKLVVETYSATQNPRIFVDGAWLDLTSLITNLGSFTIGDAGDINDRGDLVGWGLDADGNQRGFILEIDDCD